MVWSLKINDLVINLLIGCLELIAKVLLHIPKTVWFCAGFTLGIIGGAIFMHLTQFGNEVIIMVGCFLLLQQ